MSYPEEIRATDLRRAWANFDPYLPLPAGSKFYVHRPGRPLRRLKEALLMSQEFGKTPKYFFSGHRGSGKSTEMNRLAANPQLRERFVIIHYSIRDYADVNDLNHIDVLFTLGAQMFMQYTAEDGRYQGKLNPALLKELEDLQGRISEKVRVTNKEGLAESEASFNAYFLKALGKIKQEEISRREIRQILEPRSSEWLQQINLIASNIASNEQKQVLVIIDDLDKPSLPTARSLFHQHIGLLQQPNFPIIYTVPIAVFYTHQFISISEGRQFLPSIKLYTRGGQPVADNFSLMRQIVGARMDREMITPEALDHIVAQSGGIVRDLTRMVQIGTMEAILGDKPQIDLAAAQRASSELRNEFRRMLTEADLATLRHLRDGGDAPPEQKAPLLFISAAVEYVNDAAWEDVHPVVRPLLNDEE
jgi:hypothetical protein